VTQKYKILAMLAAAQPDGVTNAKLNDNVCFRYSARIYDLRRDGFEIEQHHINQGLWVFVLKTSKDKIDWERLKPIQQTELWEAV